jgi:hypothetical protein
MKIDTQSGQIEVDKKSRYGKWLLGWIDGGGWSGCYTLQCAWERAKSLHHHDVSWGALGYLMASEQAFGGAKN